MDIVGGSCLCVWVFRSVSGDKNAVQTIGYGIWSCLTDSHAEIPHPLKAPMQIPGVNSMLRAFSPAPVHILSAPRYGTLNQRERASLWRPECRDSCPNRVLVPLFDVSQQRSSMYGTKSPEWANGKLICVFSLWRSRRFAGEVEVLSVLTLTKSRMKVY